jgi:SNF2 family DNA or RNA helicase
MTFEDGYTTAVNKMNSVFKLLQITSNFLIDTESKTIMDIDKDENPKLDILKDRILEHCIENGNSIIVFAWFRYEIKQIVELCRKLNISHSQYHGDVAQDDRVEIIRKFESGETSVFIAQIHAAATGITLVQASRVIYYTDTFSLGLHNQSEDRAHRIGQTESVVYESLICKGAIDERMMEARMHKQDLFDYLMGDTKRIA